MHNSIRVDIETKSPEQLEIFIAELSEINFYAFEEDKNILSAYIRDDNFDKALLENIFSGEKTSFTISFLPKESPSHYISYVKGNGKN